MRRAQIFTLIFLSVLCLSWKADDKLINNPSYRARVEKMFDVTSNLVRGRHSELFAVFQNEMSAAERDAMMFLYAFAPLSDLADNDGEFFLREVKSSLRAREEMTWGKSIPEEVFLHFVLPLRVNNENLDTFRSASYEEIKSRVQGLSMMEAALAVNHWCHEKVSYRGSDERTSSPLATMLTSWGRCGEESTFTVAAMRAVGIPARQVYTPRWAHSDDNHAWVEVWVDGRWHFLGACEPEAKLDQGWFAEPSRRAMLVHTRVYGWYNGIEPVIQSHDRFAELNLIANYASVKNLAVKVIDSTGSPADSAKVEFQLYNYAELYPIATKYTANGGLCNIDCGYGDLMVWAAKGKAYAYQWVKGEQQGLIELHLATHHTESSVIELDIVPPPKQIATEPDTLGKAWNQILLQREDSIRNAYMLTFRDSSFARRFAMQYAYPVDSITELFERCYGNWKQLTAFLENKEKTEKKWALLLLYSISDKDLRDFNADALNEHLKFGLDLPEAAQVKDPEFFTRYVLSPRIGNEMIMPWRKYFGKRFGKGFMDQVKANPEFLVLWIDREIIINQRDNLHSRAPLSPAGVASLNMADPRSRDIFFVALCRTAGKAARLSPTTAVPQVYMNGEWQDYSFKGQEAIPEKGKLQLVNAKPGTDPRYFVNFSIGRLKNGVFRSYDFEEGKKLSDFPKSIDIEEGQYMLVTGNRMTDGGVLSSLQFFTVKKDETTTVEVVLREPEYKQVNYGHPDFTGLRLAPFGETSPLSLDSLVKGGKNILIWLDPDKEPSKHILADLPLFQQSLDNWGGHMIFLVNPQRSGLSFKPAKYRGLPARNVFLADPNDLALKKINNLSGKKLEGKLPAIGILDENGDLIFLIEGYVIGIGDQLVRILGIRN